MNGNVTDRLRHAIPTIAKQKRIGLGELASEAGIHYDSINKFLKGKTTDMKIGNLERIADALGYTVVGLIQWKAK